MALQREPTAVELDDTDDECGEEEDSGGSDTEGSLVDFIDKEEHEDDETSDAESEGPTTAEEARKRDLEDIDASNIVTGKRTRRATNFYDREVFSSAEYRRMALCDVPKEELHAVEADDEEEEEEDEEDASYEASTDEDEEEDEEDEEAACCAAPPPAKSPPLPAASPPAKPVAASPPPAPAASRAGRRKK
jgi:hypothetical protein